MDKIIIISIITMFLTILFKNVAFQYIPILHIVSLIIITFLLIPYIKNIYLYTKILESNIKNFENIIKPLLKILLISIICEFSSQLCLGSGDTFLSTKILFSGKLIIISIICPYIAKFYESIVSIINEL